MLGAKNYFLLDALLDNLLDVVRAFSTRKPGSRGASPKAQLSCRSHELFAYSKANSPLSFFIDKAPQAQRYQSFPSVPIGFYPKGQY
jgi:hypothetical protein